MSDLSDLIRICGVTFERARPTLPRVIAYFDVNVVGIELRGCSLIRTARDGLRITAPRLQERELPHSARRIGVAFTDDKLHNAIAKAARIAYRALGGDDLPAWAMKPDGVAPPDAEAA